MTCNNCNPYLPKEVGGNLYPDNLPFLQYQPSSAAAISSASWSFERGAMTHGKGFGCLQQTSRVGG